jgi:hypothetical protein
MSKIFVKIGFFLLVFLITVGILVFLQKTGVFMVISNENFQAQQIMNSTFKALSDRLLALIPESNDRKQVAREFKIFRNRVQNQEISPAEFQAVAVGILNANKIDSTLSYPRASAILRIEIPNEHYDYIASDSTQKVTFFKRRKMDSTRIYIRRKGLADSSYARTRSAKPAFPGEYLEQVKKVQTMIEFDNQIQKVLTGKRLKTRLPVVRYELQNGIRIKIDPRIKAYLMNTESLPLANQMDQLERERLLQWDVRIAEENFKLTLEMARLDRKKNLEQLEKYKYIYHAEALAIAHIIKVDSLARFIDQIQIDTNLILIPPPPPPKEHVE